MLDYSKFWICKKGVIFDKGGFLMKTIIDTCEWYGLLGKGTKRREVWCPGSI